MKKRICFTLFVLLLICFNGVAQQDTLKTTAKKGWRLGALPVVAYDADLGFQYGALAQLNDFGDGTIYPDYKHMIYVEWSRFTKGTGVNQIFYDTKTLLPKHIRMTVDACYLTDKALDFYGFNGYDAVYHQEYEDDEDTANYISRMYYKLDRKQLRLLLDFQGRITSQKFRWLAGLAYYNFTTATVDIDRLNKGKSEDKKLPDSTLLLYDHYVDYGLINQDEKDGGQIFYIKTGLIYDTRDNEPAPNKGLWDEIIIMTAPPLGDVKSTFARFEITHRQYVPLISDQFTFAYRLAYQGTISGKEPAPFYVQSLLLNSFSNATNNDGLGGAKSLRGIKRNRVVGDGTLLANVELRYKVWQTRLFKQNFYIAAVAFGDYGKIIQFRDMDPAIIAGMPDELKKNFDIDAEKSKFGHLGYGAGLRLVLNDNFIVAVDSGIAGDKRDGGWGIYINIGHLF
ncbi:MAG: BamA/TamA family outer membrane protein [Bacteroidales bacterium]|nr:BamA/TamA family outer membrane protein [Lentimicrobiaceae bacterium]MDD5694591.1 BamA/TamA family outer membrane protein [Bacteroidales bacterium]